jgi:hypothetical protein
LDKWLGSREFVYSVRRNWRDRYWVKNAFIHDFLLPILFPKNNGTYLLKERWDNLIILDACRFDTFKNQYESGGLKGRLETRISRGSETKEFLSQNFAGSMNTKDLVYVTANPWVTKNFNDKFHAVVPVWKDGWDMENNTVLPGEMYRRAIQANETYPDKRLIIHFVQPHRPFLDYARVDWWKDGAPPFRFRLVWGSVAENGKSLLEVMDRQTMYRFYERNLKLVLPFVRKLLDSLKGVTVVSADHGEAFGELIHPLIPIRVYGHPGHTRIPTLVEVPWLVVESASPKPVGDGAGESGSRHLSEADEELIGKRLSALGYE